MNVELVIQLLIRLFIIKSRSVNQVMIIFSRLYKMDSTLGGAVLVLLCPPQLLEILIFGFYQQKIPSSKHCKSDGGLPKHWPENRRNMKSAHWTPTTEYLNNDFFIQPVMTTLEQRDYTVVLMDESSKQTSSWVWCIIKDWDTWLLISSRSVKVKVIWILI